MHIQHDYSLQHHNTFGLRTKAAHFVSIDNISDLEKLIKHALFADNPRLVLGGGSNLLFLDDYFPGLVIHLTNKGVEVVDETAQHTIIRAAAGENWHQFVQQSIDWGLGGLENLSLIPGNVGAAPMQNIGAYGVELKDVFQQLHALNLETGKMQVFDAKACQFGYRSSVFKTNARGKFIIISVDFKLDKHHSLKLDYGAIRQELSLMGIEKPSIKQVSEAVCRIRGSKLPDPEVLGNAGSFFKNPVVPLRTFKELQLTYPKIVAFPEGNVRMKLAAGWLIEQAGLKGYSQGDAAVHDRQALVIVNRGKATGKQLYKLAMHVKSTVFRQFGVELEPEVNVIGL
jgi:UDP-N-acetylmuramate dehydrogenase